MFEDRRFYPLTKENAIYQGMILNYDKIIIKLHTNNTNATIKNSSFLKRISRKSTYK